MLSRSLRYLLSIVSGILLVISFPYTGSLTPLVFIAVVPLLLVEHDISNQNKSSFNVLLHAYITFFIYNLGASWWIWNSTEVGGILAFVFNSLLMALAFQVFHFAKKHVQSKYSPFYFVAIWVTFEYLHFNWELSWPWMAFGDMFSIRTNWIQWYEFTGVLGGTTWVAIVNVLMFKAISSYFKKEKTKSNKLYIAIAGTILIPIVLSYLMLLKADLKGETMEVVIVQPNIDPYNEKFDANSTVESQLTKFFNTAEEKLSQKTELLMGPETAISQGFIEPDLEYFDFYRLIKVRLEKYTKTELLIGASTALIFDKKVSRATLPLESGNGFYESYNTSLFMPTKGKHSFIHKSKLVLGVEKLPFSNIFPFLEELAISNGGTSGTLGIESHPKNFKAAKATIAPIICYESIYGEFVAQQVRSGAELLCIITNDGWWKDTPGYKQHFSFARLRAIENRRWVVRSANTGTSGVINEKGEVLQQTGWWVPVVLKTQAQLSKSLTIYARFGDYLGVIFAMISSILVLFSIWFKFTKRKKATGN
ncbi:MAG: apolipoprotein N-acyltransferase [Crocinitomicaceae bacterium]|nr:apolipoprotein N-acyltransferase [Crocinitomicaceae bacterium]